MKISQISVFVENKPGRISEITGLLGNAGIDMRAFSMADTTDFGIMRIIVNDPDKALSILTNEGLTVSKTQVIAVKLVDKPGALYNVLKILSDQNIDVEYAYAFLTRKEDDAFVVLRIEDLDRADKILADAGVQTMKPEELYKI